MDLTDRNLQGVLVQEVEVLVLWYHTVFIRKLQPTQSVETSTGHT